MRRGEVWLLSLDPTVGGEIRKTRPCVIVSPAELLDVLRTVIVVPLTTGNRPASFRIPVRFQRRDGLVLPEQLRAVDRSRLIRRLGVLEQKSFAAVLETLRDFFAD